MKLRPLARLCTALLLIIITTYGVFAQTAEEIVTAKATARALGYNESEISDMMRKGRSEVATVGNKATIVPKITRIDTLNTAVAEHDVYGNAGYNRITLKPSKIYGHDLFRSPALNFIPSYNIPTPADYKLAAGDEIVIDIWGSVFLNQTYRISPEGSVTIQDLGPVYLTGRTIDSAREVLINHLSKIYSGMRGSNPDTHLRISLGRIRSFSVNVVGDVERPGTYTLPSLSNVFSALYLAGGPTEIGSIRNVQIFRNNKLFKSFDLYDFVINGDFSANIRLEDNDLIKVGPYSNLVTVDGKVKRAMIYEIKDGETVADILNYAGGFAKDAYMQRVHIVRVKGERTESFDLNFGQFATLALSNGDIVTVPSNIDENKNEITIAGAVWHPGNYAISDSLMTLRQLILSAGGIKEDTYLERGYIERLNDIKEPIFVNFSVKDVMSGEEDVALKNDDKVRLFSTGEFAFRTFVYTKGELNRPDTFVFRPGMTLGDVILMSGGYTIGAAQSNIDIARRNSNDGSASESDTISTVFNFNLSEHPEAIEFALEPYDAIFVRTAPNYKPQQTISILGEVVFPGQYVMEKNVVRITDVIFKAGGFNSDAYIKGCVLERRLTEEEYARTMVALEYARHKAGDSTTFDASDLKRTFTIGIDMDAAMDSPGSYADIVIRDGDVIRVPKMNNTVTISGGVLYRNVVTYNPGYSVSDYIEQAGGYIKQARKNKTYIVYMNGNLATRKSKGGLKVEPGCEIVVPVKEAESGRKLSATEIFSIATSTASLATMVISLVRLLTPSAS